MSIISVPLTSGLTEQDFCNRSLSSPLGPCLALCMSELQSFNPNEVMAIVKNSLKYSVGNTGDNIVITMHDAR